MKLTDLQLTVLKRARSGRFVTKRLPDTIDGKNTARAIATLHRQGLIMSVGVGYICTRIGIEVCNELTTYRPRPSGYRV